LQLHHELPAAAPCAAGRPVVLVAIRARVVGETTLASYGLLDVVDGGAGGAVDRFGLGVAIGEDVQSLISDRKLAGLETARDPLRRLNRTLASP
jgi:hypothetical protein